MRMYEYGQDINAMRRSGQVRARVTNCEMRNSSAIMCRIGLV